MNTLPSKQKGVGLIEVMVALILLAVGILGFVALQGNAIKATDESLERSQSLVIMRNIAEKIRANPLQVATYAAELQSNNNTQPANKCGLDGQGSLNTFCNQQQLAQVESFFIKRELAKYGFRVQLHPCPTSGGGSASNVMYSYCLFSAWGETQPTIQGPNSCVDSNGTYRRQATCMMMEL